MAKVTLTDLTSIANDTSATNSINENFQALEDYVNNNVLSRDTGVEVNTMQNELDMNGQSILNVADINGEDVGDLATGATASAASAAASAALAAADAVSTAADAAATAADVVSTNADVVSTAADVVSVNNALATVDNIIDYAEANSSSSYTPDMGASANFHITLEGANVVINNPTNKTIGQSGVFVLIQDGSGSRGVSWGTDFEFSGGTPPTPTTTAGGVDLVAYYVLSSTRILCSNAILEFS